MAKGKYGLPTITVAESKAYRAAIEKAESGIKSDNVETAILIDRRGNVVFTESQGNTGSVQFTAKQGKKMKDATLTHNHPRGSTFSPEDVWTLIANDLFAIRATSKKQTYQLERMKGSFQKKSAFAADLQKAYHANKAVCDVEYSKIEHLQYGSHNDIAKFYSECDRLNQKLDKMQHEWIKKNAKSYGYRYSVFR